MAVTTGTAILLGSLAGAGATVFAATRKPSFPNAQIPELPPAPDPKKIEADKRAELLKKNLSKTQTVLTSPLGIIDPESTQKKSLLGE